MYYICLSELYCLTTNIFMHAYTLELGGTFVYLVALDLFGVIVGLAKRPEVGLRSIWWGSLVHVWDRRLWKNQ